MTKGSLPGHFEDEEEKTNIGHVPEDKGCKKAKKLGYYGPCLECTIEPCLEDVVQGVSKAIRRSRDDKMLKAIRNGQSSKEVAVQFGVSKRTVERAIKGRM